MREARQILGPKKAITPLGIVGLVLSLIEVTLIAAITQTTGGIQVALTAFTIAFTTMIALGFFVMLWRKNYVLYSPEDFGKPTPKDFVEAMQRQPALSAHFSLNQDLRQSNERESKAMHSIVETFIERMDLNGLLCLYAFSLAHESMLPLDMDELGSTIGFDYAWGILTATTATGLIDYTSSSKVVNVIYMDEKLRDGLEAEVKRRANEADESDFSGLGVTKEVYLESIQNKINDLEQYRGGSS